MEQSSICLTDDKSKYFALSEESKSSNCRLSPYFHRLRSAEREYFHSKDKEQTAVHNKSDELLCNKNDRKCVRRSARLKKSPYFTIAKIKRPRHLLYPNYTPPSSPFNLIQEELHNDPWKVLVSTIFLNRTAGKLKHVYYANLPFAFSVGKKAIPVLKEFLVQYDCAEVTVNSDQGQIAQLMEPLGLHHKRAQILMQFSSKSLCISQLYKIQFYSKFKYPDAKRMDI